MHTLLKLLGGLVAGYAAVLLLAWRFQDRLAFPAPRLSLPEPSAHGLADGRRVAVTTSDGITLRGWYLPPAPPPTAAPSAPGLLWFGGNAETVAGVAPVLRALRPRGVALLALDYRGYGASEGRPSEPGIYRDAEAAWEFLAAQPEIDARRIAVYGRSLGTAPALHLATARDIRAVVLEAPFTSARAMARHHYPLLPAAILRLRLDNLTRARALRAPLLVVHGSDDVVVPVAMGRAVAAAGSARELVVVAGAGHNDLFATAGGAYRDRVLAFLEATLHD